MPVPLFLDVSGGELLVVLLFVLLFFGSKGVPEVARTMGRAMRQFRDATAEVQREIEKGAHEVKKGFDEQRKTFRIEPPEHSAPVGSALNHANSGPPDAPTTSPVVDTPQEQAPRPGAEGQ
ncbi:MAG: twin-arginine translocase TatA/TatE family subunit [Flavobacteriales bacterium]|nr:twin-arginine translocase TatA/TatE family subunit [Flavobacteriales bacterium]MCL4282462.1 twin-arginine translocase TatA/TatE family subunit [Flavobacteriales bacterium]